MATGAHAVDRVAEATGLSPSTVFRAARAMREADPGLWPEAEKGGGRGAAHLEPRHLVNLALALAVAEPLTAAPQAVMGHRVSAPRELPFRQSERMGRAARLLAAAAVFSGKGGLGDDLSGWWSC